MWIFTEVVNMLYIEIDGNLVIIIIGILEIYEYF